MANLTKAQAECAKVLNGSGLWPVTEASARRAADIATTHGAWPFMIMLGAAEMVRRHKASDPNARALRQEAAVIATKRTINAVVAALKPVIDNQRIAEENAKVVELLDSWTIGGVRLGDCTRDKLIAESGKLVHAANTGRRHAALYMKMAAVLKPGETVRKSPGRKTLLAILRSVVP